MSETKYVQIPRDADDFVKDWQEEIDRGIKARKADERLWKQNEDFEDLKQWPSGVGTLDYGVYDQVTVNKLGAYIRDYRADVAFNDPMPKLVPRTSDGWEPMTVPVIGPDGRPKQDPETGEVMVRKVVKAKVRESLLRGIVSQPMFGLQATNSRLVKAGVLAVGYLKTGYMPDFKTLPEPEGDQKIDIKEDGSLDLSKFERNKIDGSLVPRANGTGLVETRDLPVYDDYFIDWVPYRNIITDPDGGNDWRDHRWVAEEYVRTLDEVKEDPLFKNTDDLRPSGFRGNEDNEPEWNVTPQNWKPYDDDGEISRRDMLVRYWWIYDMVKKREYVVADGYGKCLRDEEYPEWMWDHPYADFRPNERIGGTGKFLPRPIACDLVPVNQWYNQFRQAEFRAGKSSTPKVLVREGAMDSVDVSALTDDEYNAVVKVKMQPGADFDSMVRPYIPAPIPEAIYVNTDRAARDFDEVGGMPQRAERGGSDTATEAGIIESRNRGRTGFDGKVLAQTWRLIYKKLNDALDYTMTVPRAVQLEGSDGQAFTAMVDREMIAGDYDVDVDVEEMKPSNPGMEVAQTIQLIQALGQMPHFASDEVLVRELFAKANIRNERFVQKMAEVAERAVQMQEMQAATAMAAAQSKMQPEAGPPASEAQAASQAAAGNQTPRMRGAR
jgi:hypothetical protein